MAPHIELSETTFRRLQTHGLAFVDTPESVISKLLDIADARDAIHQGTAVESSAVQGPAGRRLNPDSTDELRHTKVLSAFFARRSATKWNELIAEAHAEAFARLGSFDAVRQITISTIVKDKVEDSGYHYFPEIGFSLQYVEANKAWRQVLHLAKQLGVATGATFLWREKDGSAFPGEQGSISWMPVTSIGK